MAELGPEIEDEDKLKQTSQSNLGIPKGRVINFLSIHISRTELLQSSDCGQQTEATTQKEP